MKSSIETLPVADKIRILEYLSKTYSDHPSWTYKRGKKVEALRQLIAKELDAMAKEFQV